jgi:hypothetical protein
MRGKIPKDNIREMDLAIVRLSELMVRMDFLLLNSQTKRVTLVADLKAIRLGIAIALPE